MIPARDFSSVLGLSLLFAAFLGVPSTTAQDVRLDLGTGWAIPTSDVEQVLEVTVESSDGPVSGTIIQPVDLKSGKHVYVGLGFVRSAGEKLAIGGRLRAHRSTLSNSINCTVGTCTTPEGYYRALTVEGRLILTSTDWIHPYLLVGLGIVETSVEQVVASEIDDSRLPSSLTYPAASVIDAGGDIGIGASVAVFKGLYVDGEFRASGALPGGKDNAVTLVPFSLGLSYRF